MPARLLCYYCRLQYHYRPGTVSGWLAHQLDDYSQRRRSEPSCTNPCLHLCVSLSSSMCPKRCNSHSTSDQCWSICVQAQARNGRCMCSLLTRHWSYVCMRSVRAPGSCPAHVQLHQLGWRVSCVTPTQPQKLAATCTTLCRTMGDDSRQEPACVCGNAPVQAGGRCVSIWMAAST